MKPISNNHLARLRLSEVFGLDRAKNPASYVVRRVETDFVNALDDDAVSAIVVYGMSKQGKSSLLRHSMAKRDHILTDGNRGLTLEDVFRDLLCKAGFEYEERETGGEFKVQWFFGGAGVDGKTVRRPLAIRMNNPASVVGELARHRSRPVIVIDQFHTLDLAVQREFATAIATFAAHSCKVVIIGTWTDSGYLIRYNNNLIGTVREFSFDEWSSAELHAVLNKGLPLLGLDGLANGARNSIVDRSAGNVALLQELTKLCLAPYEKGGNIAAAAQELNKTGVDSAANGLLDRVFRDVLQALRPISEIGSGNPLAKERSRSWWVLNAFLECPTDDVMNGVSVEMLLQQTNKLVQAATGKASNAIAKAELVGLLKQHWYAEQTKHGATPILAYHEVKDAVVIVDAWTKFVLRTRDTRQKLRAAI